ncbi:division/cell wall cluster transcriptional repressor MraZ [Thermophagus sp. OGC60D27]|uniref:division/cell wall cluster transcriptional repressor MraZ n=1 Tax=Thermophagus sp. OGC60D27 TaxID=3458415 RepID=UPI0040384E90
MCTFIGDFECRTDAKGRIVFPSVFKRELGAGDLRLIVRKDLFEPCLVLYPYSVWEEKLERIRAGLNPYNREHTRFLRLFFRGSAEVSLDGNGRFLVPKRLMEQVEIDREVVLLGVDRYIEMWNKEGYYRKDMTQDELGNLAEKIFGDNITF